MTGSDPHELHGGFYAKTLCVAFRWHVKMARLREKADRQQSVREHERDLQVALVLLCRCVRVTWCSAFREEERKYDIQKAECEYAGFFCFFYNNRSALISVGDFCNCKDGTFRGEKKRLLQVIYLKKNSHETKTVHVAGWKRVYFPCKLGHFNMGVYQDSGSMCLFY